MPSLEDVQRFFSWIAENPESLCCLVPVGIVGIVILGFIFVSGGGMAASLDE